MIPRLMNRQDIHLTASDVCAAINETVMMFGGKYNEPEDKINPHWVIEDEEYWVASKFIAIMKREIDKVLSQKIAKMEAEGASTS